MNICFTYDHLFPSRDRAGRHIETLVRSFRDRGHQVAVITTQTEDSHDEEGVTTLRLRESPGARGQARRDNLIGKAIAKFLKEEEIQVLFGEGLTPLSAVSLKASRKVAARGILRVLADASGIAHGIGADRKLTPSALKKRIGTMLGYADIAAASSAHCAELLEDIYNGPVRVIPKCVDTRIFDATRVRDVDRESLRERFDIPETLTLLYSREEMRADTIAATIPLMARLIEKQPEAVFLVAGHLDDEESLAESLAEAGLEKSYRLLGSLGQSDLAAAYTLASLYVAPPDSRASESELLESLAMGLGLAITSDRAAQLPEFVESGGVLVLDQDLDAAAEMLMDCLGDESRLESMGPKGVVFAGTMDIAHAVDQVEVLCQDVLGVDSEPSVESDDDEDQDASEDASGDDDSEAARSDDRGSESRDRESDDDDDDDPDELHEEPVEREVSAAEDVDSDESTEGEEDRDEEDRRGRRRRRRRRGRGRGEGDAEADADSDSDSESESDGEDRGDGQEGPMAEDGEEEDGKRKPKRDGASLEEELDSAHKRLRELDSKLTLRDLMPFLRPPKDVFVISLATHEGRHRSGDALMESFSSIDQNMRTRQFDLAEFVSRNMSRDELNDRLREHEAQESNFLGEVKNEGDGEAEGGGFHDLLDGRLENLILEKRPHQVVLTHYLPVRRIAELKAEHDLRMQIAVVIPHQDLLPDWVAEGVDHYFVANDKIRFKLMRAGVESSQIDVVGVPVAGLFEEEMPRDRTLREFRLKSGQSTLLYRVFESDDDEAVRNVESIVGLGIGMNVLVLAAGRPGVAKKIEEIEVPRAVNLRTETSVENMRDLMAASDLLVTPAGSHTAAEALASGVPVLVMAPAEGLEERSADWLIERGVALRARDGFDLEWQIQDLFKSQGARLRRLKDRAAEFSRRRGAAKACVDRIARNLN